MADDLSIDIQRTESSHVTRRGTRGVSWLAGLRADLTPNTHVTASSGRDRSTETSEFGDIGFARTRTASSVRLEHRPAEPAPRPDSSDPEPPDGKPATTEPANDEPTTPAPAGHLQSSDTEVTEDDLKSLLIEVEGFTRGDPIYRKSFHASASASYSDGTTYLVKVTDYADSESTLRFLKHYSPDQPSTQFVGRTAFIVEAAEPRFKQILIAAGRFGLFVTVPPRKQGNAETLARPLVEHMMR